MVLRSGKSVSIIIHRLYSPNAAPSPFFSLELKTFFLFFREVLSLTLLPALTWAACRTRVKVMNAVTVESISHLFVFHLVDHLCISMAHKWIKPLGDFRWFSIPSRPQSQIMMETVLEKSHMCRVSASSLSYEAPDPPFPVPSLHSEGSRALTKTRRTQSLPLVRPPTGGLGQLHKPEPRLQRIDRVTSPWLANHGAGNPPLGPPISSPTLACVQVCPGWDPGKRSLSKYVYRNVKALSIFGTREDKNVYIYIFLESTSINMKLWKTLWLK